MVDDIAFYALYKLTILVILCKADDFCLFIELTDEIQKSRLVSLSNFEFNFFIVCGVTLRKHYIIKAKWSVI